MIRISKPAWVLGCFIIFVSSATLVVVVVLQNLKSPGKNGIIVPEKVSYIARICARAGKSIFGSVDQPFQHFFCFLMYHL